MTKISSESLHLVLVGAPTRTLARVVGVSVKYCLLAESPNHDLSMISSHFSGKFKCNRPK